MYKVIFNCPAFHHIGHLMPVIEQLKKNSSYKIYLITRENIILENIKIYSNSKLLPPRLYDAYISTEIEKPPFWVRTKKIFFGHGVGPKMRYQKNPKISEFDYSFAPCSLFAKAHSEMGLKVVESGLPILDDPIAGKKLREIVFNKLGLSSKKLVINYIPSWSVDTHILKNIRPTIEKISKWLDYHIVISPHPNLLKPERCDGLDLFSNLPGNIILNTSINTLDVTKFSEYIVGDISSAMFEGMALGKLVIWDGDEANYVLNEATSMLPVLRAICPVVDDIVELRDMSNLRDLQQEFIKSYIYNIGNSREFILESLCNIIEGKN